MRLLRTTIRAGLLIAGLATLVTPLLGAGVEGRVARGADPVRSCWSDAVSFMSECSPTATQAANTGGHVWSLTLLNETGSSQNGSISCTTGGQASNCSLSQSSFSIPPNDIFDFTATYDVGSPGTGTVTITVNHSLGTIDNTLTVTIPQPTQPLLVDLTLHNADNLSLAACVAGCFDARVGYTTPAYVSLDVPRSVTLVHSQAQARAMGLVQADVTDTTSTPGAKMSIRLRRPDSTWVTFTTGTQEVYYTSGTGPNRLAAQFDATPLATGAHDYRLHVRSWSAGGAMLRESTTPIRVLVLNEKDSEFGWGWSMPGLQRLYEQADGAIVLTEGDGTIRRFALVSCPSTCSYTSPAGEFSTLTRRQFWSDGYKWDRTYPDGTSAVYRTDGRLAYVRDRFNNQTTFAYSGTPTHLSSITDPAGKVVSFSYGADNKLDWLKDPGDRYTYFAINGVKDLTEITDAASVAALRLTYDAQHRATRRTDRRGGLWDFAYDFAGKLKADTLPPVVIGGLSARPVVRFRSTESILLVDPGSGYGTSSNPAPRVDTPAVRAEVTNARGFVTKYALDRWGAATRVEEPLGRVTRVWRNANAQDTLSISPRGDSARMVWMGTNLTQIVRRPLGRTVNMEYETTFNQLKRVYGDADSLWNYWSSGRLDSTRVGRSTEAVTAFKYDTRGRDTLVIDPQGHKTRRYFAAIGWQNVDSIKAGTRRTVFSYDTFGRDTLRKDPQNNTWKTNYDVLNRVIRQIGPAPINDTTTFSYDSLYIRAVVDAKGQRFAFQSNALGWVVSDTNALGVARTFAFDSNGNVISATNRRAQTVSLAYDSLDNMRSRAASDVGTTTFIIDPLDRFVAVSNSESTDTLKFDVSGRPIAEIAVRGGARYELTSAFDIRDRRTQVQMNASGWTPSIGFRYNRKSLLDTLIDVNGGRTSIAYDNDGMRSELQLPNGVSISQGFPSTHTPSKTEYSDESINTAIGRRFGYDSLARIREWVKQNSSYGRDFSYDPLGRLSQYRDFHADACTPIYEEDDPPPGAVPIGWDCSNRVIDLSVSYTYDKVGNRTDLGGIPATGNRLVKFDGDSLVYDADGNLTKRIRGGSETQRLYWNSLSQLLAVWTSGSDSVSFAYDGSGRRTRKWSAAVTKKYLYDGDDLFGELDGANNVVAEYAYYPGTDRPHSVRRSGALYFYGNEFPGHVVGLIDGSGSLVNRLLFEPFGTLQDSTIGLSSDMLRFASREFDKETGFYFLRARYYDPKLGRFNSEDPIGLEGGINPYVYASNDPVNGRDPSGLCDEDDEAPHYVWDSDNEVWVRTLETVTVCGDGGSALSRALMALWSEGRISWGLTGGLSSSSSGGGGRVRRASLGSGLEGIGQLAVCVAGRVKDDLTFVGGALLGGSLGAAVKHYGGQAVKYALSKGNSLHSFGTIIEGPAIYSHTPAEAAALREARLIHTAGKLAVRAGTLAARATVAGAVVYLGFQVYKCI